MRRGERARAGTIVERATVEVFAKRTAFFAAFCVDADGRLTYESDDGKRRASVAVTNMTDKVHYTNGFAFLQSGTGHNVIARPREWEFTLRRRL